jgi:hypothetical protein
MKKNSRPASLKARPIKQSTIKKFSAKPKAPAKPSTKIKSGKAQGQTELAQVVAQLAVIAETLARAADRLAVAVRQHSLAGKEQDETQDDIIADKPAELSADSPPPEQHPSVADAASQEVDRTEQTTEIGDDNGNLS